MVQPFHQSQKDEPHSQMHDVLQKTLLADGVGQPQRERETEMDLNKG